MRLLAHLVLDLRANIQVLDIRIDLHIYGGVLDMWFL